MELRQPLIWPSEGRTGGPCSSLPGTRWAVSKPKSPDYRFPAKDNEPCPACDSLGCEVNCWPHWRYAWWEGLYQRGLSHILTVIASPSAALRINSAKQSLLTLMRWLRVCGPRNDNRRTMACISGVLRLGVRCIILARCYGPGNLLTRLALFQVRRRYLFSRNMMRRRIACE